MSRLRAGTFSLGTLALLSISIASCGRPAALPATSAPASVTAPIVTTATPPHSNVIALPAIQTSPPADTLEAASTQTPVEVKAKGHVFIRRGPDLAFNPVSVLSPGETAVPTGRDVLGNWLRIPLPGAPSKAGWISIMTEFTEVRGDIQLLPEISPVVWPDLAFVRNCTFHELMIKPGGIILPAVINFPANDVQVNPGEYVVIDLDVDSYPQVLSIDIREGSSIDIVVDGNGMKKKCPVP
ncbi:MAG TPA: hypothetical protein VIU38_13035 [Anaerolineales bacterium]